MILAPFKWIVALFFNASLALFGDPGWAVVGMSVLLSLLLTPLYVWIERRKTSDRARYAPMQAEIDKIDAVYSGRERYYYTREIQRRHRYRPWVALVPTLGLLVQIPFLLAAYHYLSELPVFAGVSFGYIRDLSRPDTVAVVAGMPINLLAILMTVINLVSGWRYAESGKPKDRLQYAAVAFVFLFLLYGCAASVVLYWTLSNALSLVRSEIFFRKRGKSVPTRSEWTNRTPVFRTVSAACLVSAGILGLDAGWFVLRSDLTGAPLLWSLRFGMAVFSMAAFAFAFLSVRVGGRAGIKTPLAWYAAALLSAGWAISLVLSLTCRSVLPRECGVLSLCIFAFVLAVGATYCLTFFEAKGDVAGAPPSNADARGSVSRMRVLGVASVACLSVQLFLCAPVCVFVSCPDGASDVSLRQLLATGGVLVLATTCVAAVVLRLLPRGLAHAAALIAMLAFAVTFVYGNLVPADYGVLFQGTYAEPARLNPSATTLCLEALAAGFVIAVIWRFVSRGTNCFGKILIVLAVVMVSYAVRMVAAVAKMQETGEFSTDGAVMTHDGRLFRFSRQGKNVVFVVLDSFMGQRFGKIVEQDEALSRTFDGFTWYPLTLSASWFTFPDVCAIWGGEEYFPWHLRERRLGDVFPEAWNLYLQKIRAKGYRMSTSTMAKTFDGSFKGAECLFSEMDYCPDGEREAVLMSLNFRSLWGNGVLRALPFAFRSVVYDGGRWHSSSTRTPLDSAFEFLEALVPNSEVVESESGLYVHIHSEATHYPYETPTTAGRMRQGVDACYRWSLQRIAAWLEWMKANEIYDNTRIVLCSDHGINDQEGAGLDERYVRNPELIKSVAGACPYFALLAVKDFSSHGSLKADTATKTIAHAAYFALDDARFSKAVSDIVVSDVVNPYPPDWRDRKGFDVRKNVRVTGSAGNGEDWHEVK